LFVRLGRVAEEQLKDDARAVLAYSRAVEQAGDQPELLAALDRLYTRLENEDKVAEILERRVARRVRRRPKRSFISRLALLQIKSFKEPEAGSPRYVWRWSELRSRQRRR